MKRILKYSLLSASIFLAANIEAQVNLVNNNTTLKINAGVDLRVENGAIRNSNSGTIANDGNIYLDNDFVQNTGATYTGGGLSWLWFEGGSNQNITGDAPLSVTQLRVENGNRLILGNTVNVSQTVDLMFNGDIELGAHDLIVAPAGVITNYNANNYIITNGTGSLQQEAGASNLVYPVGNSIYNPATINNSGTVDNISVRVVDQVQTGYPVGGVETAGVVSKAWFLEEETVGGSDVSLTLQWDTADELAGLDRSVSGISHWDVIAWDRSPTWTNATNVGGTSWTQTRTGITSFSPFAIEDQQLDLPVELLFFDAERKDVDEVLLTWSTATEINNKGFYVERMLEGETEFKTVGFVEGTGTSSIANNYQLIDPNAYEKVSYYRLRQVDFDGQYDYSETRAVFGLMAQTEIAIYPNPTTDVVNIRFSNLAVGSEAAVQLLDARGRLVYDAKHAVSSQEALILDLFEQLPSAMYILSVHVDNGEQLIKKIVRE
ncbi:MAG: T9SS type A sorting domain-containing protein [Aureispira sp.]|nr:T9SS type A sorting domain-containing protein [Aureispira sp.]